MKPTRAHYFYANNGPVWAWMVALPLLGAGVMAFALGPPPEMSTPLSRAARDYVWLLGLGSLLGWCIGGLAGTFILGPLYHHRAQLNGAPFMPGEEVQILAGRDRGRVARVAEPLDYRGYVKLEDGRRFRALQLLRRGDGAAMPTGRAPGPIAKDASAAPRAPR